MSPQLLNKEGAPLAADESPIDVKRLYLTPQFLIPFIGLIVTFTVTQVQTAFNSRDIAKVQVVLDDRAKADLLNAALMAKMATSAEVQRLSEKVDDRFERLNESLRKGNK